MGSRSKSKSSSTSSNTTITNNIDKRQVVGEGAVGVTLDTGNVSVNMLDGGAIQGALDLVKASDVLASDNYDKLLDVSVGFFEKAGEAVKAAQESTLKQIDSINKQTEIVKGQIDDKTLLIVAGAVVLLARGK